jgi:hypothetical protein
MDRTLARRLDRLEEQLLPPPNVPTKVWQIVIITPKGPVNGPLLKWGPGYKNPDPPFDWTVVREKIEARPSPGSY